MDKLPKDLANAKRGYEAFYSEQPHVWFEDLNHEYQMKWVRAARAIIEENSRYSGPGRRPKEDSPGEGEFWKDLKNMDPKLFIKKHVPSYGSRLGWSKMKNPTHRKAAKRVWEKHVKGKPLNGA